MRLSLALLDAPKTPRFLLAQLLAQLVEDRAPLFVIERARAACAK